MTWGLSLGPSKFLGSYLLYPDRTASPYHVNTRVPDGHCSLAVTAIYDYLKSCTTKHGPFKCIGHNFARLFFRSFFIF